MKETPMPDKAALKVSVAYDLPRGDPLRNWSVMDFRIGNNKGDLPARGKGITVKALQGNVVLLTDLQDDFRFAVEGFDNNRDLFVRVDDVTGNQEMAT
jgi:hypothetical protein